MERLRFYWDHSIDLHSEHGKAVYFWSWGSYLLYNAISTRKIAKIYLVFFFFILSKEICSPPSCLCCQQPQQLLRKQISTMFIHSVVKLNFSRLSVFLHNAPPQWHQMTSHNITFIDVISRLYHVVSNQNRNAVFMWSVDMCFILPNK